MIKPAVAELEQALRQLLLPLPDQQRVWIGFSGGLDSTVLLWLASRVLPATQLQAIYVNHNLQTDASAWDKHCSDVCSSLSVPYRSVSVSPSSASENDARNARYQAFESLLQKGDLLLLAHHQDDQAETLFMRLMRGAAVQGLASMPQRRPLGKAELLRPLLNTSRQQLEQIAEQAGLSWIEDPSNQNTKYLRNWVRNELGGVLSQRWPDWSARMAQSAEVFSQTAELNRDLALIDAGGEFNNPLTISPEASKSEVRLGNLVYYWLRSLGGQVHSRRQLDEAVDHIQASGEAGVGSWQLGSARIHLYRGQLWYEQHSIEIQRSIQMRLTPGVIDLSVGALKLEQSDIGLPLGLEVELRGRRAGDRLNLGWGHQSVKKFMNDKKLPPWLRDSWPLILCEGEIISIVGVWVAPTALKPGGLTLNWER